MKKFRIIGGRQLKGELRVQGAKNEVLQVICACALTEDTVTLNNVPYIQDVKGLFDILDYLGADVNFPGQGVWKVACKDLDLGLTDTDKYRKMSGSLRGSVMLAGSMLGRYKRAVIWQPGGDKIGRRRLDTHLLGFEALGAKIEYDSLKGCWLLDGSAMHGSYVLLQEASVTGTANVVMAAVLTEGVTEIFNAACEPYVVGLCRLLVNMGAKIEGIGSNLLRIEGVKTLHGAEHTMEADMIEVGSFIGMAAMTSSVIMLKDLDKKSLGIIPSVFEGLGIKMSYAGKDLQINGQGEYFLGSNLDGSMKVISDAPWPGFSPDLLSIVLAVGLLGQGSIMIHQKMFESRLYFTDKLIAMGGRIILCDPHRAVVIGGGKGSLRGVNMTSPDIRAGIAMLLSAMSAKGVSEISNIEQIERGYEDIDVRLNALGADIERI